MRIKEILGGWTVTIHIDCLEDNPLTNDLNHCNLVSYTITMKVCVYISFQSSKYLVCSLYYIKLLKLYSISTFYVFTYFILGTLKVSK